MIRIVTVDSYLLHNDRYAPLHAAAVDRNSTIIQLLLQAGMNINACDIKTGQTPLMCLLCDLRPPELADDADEKTRRQADRTEQDRMQQTLQLLLQHGADLYAVDAEHNSVLHHLALHGWKARILEIVLEKMDKDGKVQKFVRKRNKYGNTAMVSIDAAVSVIGTCHHLHPVYGQHCLPMRDIVSVSPTVSDWICVVALRLRISVQ